MLTAAFLDRVTRSASPAASQTLVHLGGACSETWQCAQQVGCGNPGAVYCADNGYADDGYLNCCGYQGIACGSHAHCCAGLLCLGQTSIDGCGAGTCQPRDAIGIIGLGASCTESHQCSQETAPAICSIDGSCCTTQPGVRCYWSGQCCGGLTCLKPAGAIWVDPGICGSV